MSYNAFNNNTKVSTTINSLEELLSLTGNCDNYINVYTTKDECNWIFIENKGDGIYGISGTNNFDIEILEGKEYEIYNEVSFNFVKDFLAVLMEHKGVYSFGYE